MRAKLMVVVAFALAGVSPISAQTAPPSPPPPPSGPLASEELVLEGDNIIDVLLNGVPIRLEVRAEAFGPPVINPELAQRLALVSTDKRAWRFGALTVTGVGGPQVLAFGSGPNRVATPIHVTWADRPTSVKADGVIGVHHLPYARVTYILSAPRDAEQVQRIPLVRAGGDVTTRMGAGVTLGKRELMMIFVPERAENLITAPTANFIATHAEGGFVPGSDGIAVMDFAVERPTRTMRIAYPIELGNLLVDQFAVRVEDYGDPKRVGEIGDNDPRFEKGQILISRRKGKGKPDLLTRIGRNQIAHCSRLTYDLAKDAIELSCVEAAQ